MRLAIASGKGGTGKTTLAVGLAVALASRADSRIRLLDCDVEQPNDHLFLHPVKVSKEPVHVSIPQVDESKCEGCGDCVQSCRFNALALVGGRLLSFPELCHGCGACWLTCRTGAITEGSQRVGWAYSGRASTIPQVLPLFWGELDPGQMLAPPVIGKVKELGTAGGDDNGRDGRRDGRRGEPQETVEILDAPPGTSCPLVEAVGGAGFCLLVTEPTPFGLHDLELAAEVLSLMKIPCGVVLNREGVGDSRPIESFCRAKDLPVMMRIPFSRKIAGIVAAGGTLLDVDPSWGPALVELWESIRPIEYRKEGKGAHR